MRTKILSLLLLASPLLGSDVLVPVRTVVLGRNLEGQPFPKYQAGRVFAKNHALSSFWIEDAAGGVLVEGKALELPEVVRYSIHDLSVAHDGGIAVAVGAVDRQGRGVNAIARYDSNANLTSVTKTGPFAANRIGFTANGSLWVLGILKKNVNEEEPVHDILRRYDTDGRLVTTLLPRLGVSDGPMHPGIGGDNFLETSKNYAAFVSMTALRWALFSSDGLLVADGRFEAPSGIDIYTAAVTDGGRIFLCGSSAGPEGRGYLFELNTESRTLSAMELDRMIPSGEYSANVLLAGTEGENLVFYGAFRNGPSRLMWAIAP